MAYGYIFIAIAMLLLVFVGIAAFLSISSSSGMAALGFIGLGACGGIILLLVAFILFLVGLFKIYTGKEEYTPEHQKKVKLALVFLIITIIIVVVKQLLPYMLQTNITTYQDPTNAFNAIKGRLWTSQILSVLQSLFSALMSVFLILELASDNIKKMLWAGAAASVGASLAGLGMFVYVIQGEITEGTLNSLISLGSLTVGLSIIGFVIFLISYWKTYKRIKRGNLQPPQTRFGSSSQGPSQYQQARQSPQQGYTQPGSQGAQNRPAQQGQINQSRQGSSRGGQGYQEPEWEGPATSSDPSETPESSEDICPDCGSQMRYIDQYDRWYCDNCGEYK